MTQSTRFGVGAGVGAVVMQTCVLHGRLWLKAGHALPAPIALTMAARRRMNIPLPQVFEQVVVQSPHALSHNRG